MAVAVSARVGGVCRAESGGATFASFACTSTTTYAPRPVSVLKEMACGPPHHTVVTESGQSSCADALSCWAIPSPAWIRRSGSAKTNATASPSGSGTSRTMYAESDSVSRPTTRSTVRCDVLTASAPAGAFAPLLPCPASRAESQAASAAAARDPVSSVRRRMGRIYTLGTLRELRFHHRGTEDTEERHTGDAPQTEEASRPGCRGEARLAPPLPSCPSSVLSVPLWWIRSWRAHNE